MAHSHGHSHATNKSYGKAFALGIGLNVIFIAVEIIYGLIANSSALLADAGHNASDVLGLVFAWTAMWLASIKPRGKYTYGLRKTTILVSILNALLLFGAVAVIGWDAIGKFKNPEPVAGSQVMIVAAIGVVINTLTALLFMKGQKDDLNIKGAFLHMAADAGVSLGVVVAGLLINLTGKQWIDPVTSFLIIAVIVWGTWRLFTDSVDLALDAVPKHINLEKVREFLLAQKGVENIHDLHIWAMSTTKVALTAHLIIPEGINDNFIGDLQHELEHEFGINHTTLQIENKSIEEDCEIDC
ncbi:MULTISPECIES: cation diffusion facilitator family transporter [Prolixibacteraceae]|jgi:cobalt-zinc-cadmium efflux system protein|uniref:cation diffusion facilitator family transporter n=1 Tax=Prolixibacteraceae TaxID=1471398 RepID=UPI002A0A94F3|nr:MULTISPECIES: cation diffusion facilitator family transporter [Prolixibacteraceae]MDD4429532.1 cation diffusion facilitator family transporter [Paludibacter sp.]HPR59112.1 cation diffusion facilitator family transporter [Bacteroidales bacterium]